MPTAGAPLRNDPRLPSVILSEYLAWYSEGLIAQHDPEEIKYGSRWSSVANTTGTD